MGRIPVAIIQRNGRQKIVNADQVQKGDKVLAENIEADELNRLAAESLETGPANAGRKDKSLLIPEFLRSKEPEPKKEPEPEKIEIPSNWAEIEWNERLALARKVAVAMKFTEDPKTIINGEHVADVLTKAVAQLSEEQGQ